MEEIVVVENEIVGKRLVYRPGTKKNAYVLQTRLAVGETTKWLTATTRSMLSKKMTELFSAKQIREAKSKIHASKYVSRRFRG